MQRKRKAIINNTKKTKSCIRREMYYLAVKQTVLHSYEQFELTETVNSVDRKMGYMKS